MILIVDDDAATRFTMSELLKAEGHLVLTAEHGEDALGQLLMHPGRVSLIILDILMPVMNGMEFLEHKIQDRRIRDIPVIAITASGRFPNHLLARESLPKPIDADALLAAVSRLHPGKMAVVVPISRPAASSSRPASAITS